MKHIDKEAVHLGYRTKVDLRANYPISPRYALRKSIGWITACLTVSAVAGAITYLKLGEASYVLHSYALPVLASALAFVAVKYAHAVLYRMTFYYGLEGFRLIISRGILVRQVGSLPILPVSEIYIHRNLLDMLFGVANVDIYTPMETTRRFARIECLAPKTAEELREFLGELLNVQIFTAPEAKQEIHYFDKSKSSPQIPSSPAPQNCAPIGDSHDEPNHEGLNRHHRHIISAKRNVGGGYPERHSH